jgi:hypothetical protein
MFIRQEVHRLLLVNGLPYVSPSYELAQLQTLPVEKLEDIEVFREDVKLLSSLLRRDFSHWLR